MATALSVHVDESKVIGTPAQHPVAKTVDCRQNLEAIVQDGIEGVIWDRSLPSFVHQSIDPLPSDPVIECRVTCFPSEAGQHIREVLTALGIRLSSVQDWMADDVGLLAAQFAEILSTDRVGLRIESVRDDACRKFHRDAVKARLICTYSGPGTEYGVGATGHDLDLIHTVPTGCPIMLKGKVWSGLSGPMLLHRSPPIEGSGTTRLVVVIG